MRSTVPPSAKFRSDTRDSLFIPLRSCTIFRTKSASGSENCDPATAIRLQCDDRRRSRRSGENVGTPGRSMKREAPMKQSDIARVEAYLRTTLGSDRIASTRPRTAARRSKSVPATSSSERCTGTMRTARFRSRFTSPSWKRICRPQPDSRRLDIRTQRCGVVAANPAFVDQSRTIGQLSSRTQSAKLR